MTTYEGASIKQSRTPPWNDLIDCYIAGDNGPFFKKVSSRVLSRWEFSTKNDEEVIRQYGMDAEDFSQELCVDLAHKEWPRQIKDQGWSDAQINAWLNKMLKNRLITLYRRTISERNKLLAGVEVDDFHSGETSHSDFEAKECITFIKAAICENRRPKIAERLCRVMDLWSAGYPDWQMAVMLGVSKQTIEKDKDYIKKVSREMFPDRIPLGKRNDDGEV